MLYHLVGLLDRALNSQVTGAKPLQVQFADGGVWANNPVMVALVDALSCNALERDQIDILSLGCGDAEITITDAQVRRGGLWHWREIVSSAMHLSSQNALGQAGLLIGRDRLVRLNAPLLPGGAIGLDDVKRAKAELPCIAKDLAEKKGALVASRFFSDKAEPYAPFHGAKA